MRYRRAPLSGQKCQPTLAWATIARRRLISVQNQSGFELRAIWLNLPVCLAQLKSRLSGCPKTARQQTHPSALQKTRRG